MNTCTSHTVKAGHYLTILGVLCLTGAMMSRAAILSINNKQVDTALYTDKRLFQAGEPVTVNVELNATGQATDAIVDVAIRQYGSGDVVAGLLLRRLAALSGSASCSATWNSSGAAPGTYYARTRIVNAAGQVLDIQACVFKIDSQ